MKKNVLFLLLIFVMTYSHAQDLIITKDATKIQAKVSEIEESTIKYKKFDNLDGPTYTMKKSEISTIVFENGTVEVFKEEKAQMVDKPTVPSYTRKDARMNGEVKYVTRKIGDVTGYGYYSGTVFTAGYFFGEGVAEMNNVELAKAVRENPQNILNESEYQAYLEQYAPEAYRTYRTGNSLGIAGTIFLSFGLCTVVMSPLWILARDSDMGFIGAMSFLGGGTGLMLASIPFYCVAFHKMRVTSCDVYNEKYARKAARTETSFNIGANRYGLGISFRF